MSVRRRLILVALALAGSCGAAQAQSVQGELNAGANATGDNFRRDRNVSVLDRPHEGYEALGVREGSFILWPKLSAAAEYNDNILATSDNQLSDAVFAVSPQLIIASDWSRHSLRVHGQGTFNRFADNSDQNTDDYSFGADGRLDVLRSATISGGVNYAHLAAPRTSTGTEGEEFPVEYQLTTAYISGQRTFDRLKVSARVNWSKYNYLNHVGNTPQDDQDRQQTDLLARVDYAVSPDTAVFVEVTGNDRNYRLSSSPIIGGVPEFPGFVNRDSSGVSALVGANFELAALIRGEIGVGYIDQHYKDSIFHDYKGLGARAQVQWFPTQLTTVTLTGSRSVEDAALTGASSYLSTNVGLEVDHELLRNLILSANGTFGDDAYKGIDRTDKRLGLGLSASYLMNRHVGLKLAYNHFKNNSDGVDVAQEFRHYAVDRVGLTLTLQY